MGPLSTSGRVCSYWRMAQGRARAWLLVGSLFVALSGSSAEAGYGLSFEPSVGTRQTTFSATFRAPWTAILAFDADASYDWSLTRRHGGCPSSRDHPSHVTTVINGRRHEATGYDIKQGDVVAYQFAAPSGGWCTGVYRGRVSFYGANIAGCPEGSPPGCDASDFDLTVGRVSLRVTGNRALASTGFEVRLIAVAGATVLVGGLFVRRYTRLRSGSRELPNSAGW